MRYKVFVVDSNRHVICAAKLDCIDEQAAGVEPNKSIASTTLSFGTAIGSSPCFEVQRRISRRWANTVRVASHRSASATRDRG